MCQYESGHTCYVTLFCERTISKRTWQFNRKSYFYVHYVIMHIHLSTTSIWWKHICCFYAYFLIFAWKSVANWMETCYWCENVPFWVFVKDASYNTYWQICSRPGRRKLLLTYSKKCSWFVCYYRLWSFIGQFIICSWKNKCLPVACLQMEKLTASIFVPKCLFRPELYKSSQCEQDKGADRGL